MPYSDFEELQLTFDGETRAVFKAGEGSAIIVIHEAPGLYPEVVQFGRRLIKAGFTVYMPSLIGEPGRDISFPYAVETIVKACVAREFTVWATGENSTITDWLRKLARHAHSECGGPGVGAIGMCLTGGFALAMMVDDIMLAPVLSQPSLPFGVTPAQRRDLGIDDKTLERVKERARHGACVLGLRFTGDIMVPEERFKRLRDELGDNFIAVEIDSTIGNPHGISPIAHSVLVHSYEDSPGHPTREAFDKVVSFCREKLNA